MESGIKHSDAPGSSHAYPIKSINSIQYVRVCDCCGKPFATVELINIKMFEIQSRVLDICEKCKVSQ